MEQRPSVLHVYSLNPLVVDGTGNIIDAWINAAGGRNAAQIPGRTRPVSIEQVQKWNPWRPARSSRTTPARKPWTS
jgi:iron complex transport system substrate-binding protein